MQDKNVVRRRRAVLALLVALSLGLLTIYFGESAGGGLHAIQRGAQAVLAPIESGVNTAVKPVRDGTGWIGDALGAQGENDDLKAEVARLRQQVARLGDGDARERAAPRAGRPAEGGRVPRRDRAGDSARNRALADGLVLDDAGQRGLRRRDREGPAGRDRRRPRGQGRRRDRRYRRGDPDHRRRQRRVGPARAAGGPAASCSPRWGTPTTCCSTSSIARTTSRRARRSSRRARPPPSSSRSSRAASRSARSPASTPTSASSTSGSTCGRSPT